MNLKDKVVVITGASSGIGKALSDAFLNVGAQVVTPTKTEMDVRDEAQVIKFTENTLEKYGHIDIWINNAGIAHFFSKQDKVIDMANAHEIMDVNFFGTVFGCRTALKYMKEGMIVNIISKAALDATKMGYGKIYAASKWAVRGYLEALVGENLNSKIKILSVYPGGTKTSLWKDYKSKDYEAYMDPSLVAEKVIKNLEQEIPEEHLVINRPKI